VLVRGAAAAVNPLPGPGRFRICQLVLDDPAHHRRGVEEPASALTARPAGVVRRFEPRIHRGVVAMTSTLSDALVSQFLADLRRRGLPVVHTAA
jgi:hypothetical protein